VSKLEPVMVTVLGGLSRLIDDGLAERLRLAVVARTAAILPQLVLVTSVMTPLEFEVRMTVGLAPV
jgi:hypothetical protein